MLPPIGITGLKGSGKDEVYSKMCWCYPAKFHPIAFADPLRDMMRAMLDLQGVCDKKEQDRYLYGDKKEKRTVYFSNKTPRYILQTLGTEWGRDTINKAIWINIAKVRAEKVSMVGMIPVFTDVRFKDEAKFIKENNGTLLRVNRFESTDDLHESERYIPTLKVDYEIDNKGTKDDLYDEVHEVMEKLYG